MRLCNTVIIINLLLISKGRIFGALHLFLILLMSFTQLNSVDEVGTTQLWEVQMCRYVGNMHLRLSTHIDTQNTHMHTHTYVHTPVHAHKNTQCQILPKILFFVFMAYKGRE